MGENYQVRTGFLEHCAPAKTNFAGRMGRRNVISRILLSIMILCTGACSDQIKAHPEAEEGVRRVAATNGVRGDAGVSGSDFAAQDPVTLD